jgi:hypothetical protein
MDEEEFTYAHEFYGTLDDKELNKLFDKTDVEVSLSSSSDEEDSYRPSKKVLLPFAFTNATLCLTTTTFQPFRI